MDFLTPEEFADRLSSRGRKVSVWWVRRELTAGRIVGSKIGRRWFVPAESVDVLIAGGSNQPKPRKRRNRAA